MNVLEGLNSAQIKAVKSEAGPMMVIAGAGSGKTKVLTHRIAYLIEHGVDPFNILALTFTNKAAQEMKERIAVMVGQDHARNIWMGTFHSIFARILRIEHEKIGYPSNFTIYDTQDSKSGLFYRKFTSIFQNNLQSEQNARSIFQKRGYFPFGYENP